jgi:hypothetical protein
VNYRQKEDEKGMGICIPFLDRLHGYNVGKCGAKLRSDRLHYRLQTVTRAVTKANDEEREDRLGESATGTKTARNCKKVQKSEISGNSLQFLAFLFQ